MCRVLHAFSGRRRVGDLQYFLERELAQHEKTYVIHIISLDVIVDATWGDAANLHTRRFWLEGMKSKWVIAFFWAPPVNHGLELGLLGTCQRVLSSHE